MATSIKRVVSHPDELGNPAKKITMKGDAKDLATDDDRKKTPSTTAADTSPAIVEMEDPMETKPAVQVRFRASSNCSYSSSLSGSFTGLLDFHEELNTHDSRRNEAHLPRVDSTKSVGSASGTWGWFQDDGASKNNSFKPLRMIESSHNAVENGMLLASSVNLSIALGCKCVIRSPQHIPCLFDRNSSSTQNHATTE